MSNSGVLDRILETPSLARIVPRLSPEMLHSVIQSCGLEECGELVALATSDQLKGVFDLDLWRAGRPGMDEQLDGDRFGVWLEVLMESGADVAAHILARMDANLVIAALAQHALVFDAAAAPASAQLGSRIGGYRLIATRTGSWDAIVAVLAALAEDHPDDFHRVMRGCRSLSNSPSEVDGLHKLLSVRDQGLFDLAFDREQRREKQGYVTPAQARAFLQMARQHPPAHDGAPLDNPIARAYFRAIEWTAAADANASNDAAEGVAAVVDVLLDAGVLTRQPRALLDGPAGRAPRISRLQTLMQAVRDRDDAAYAMRSEECAYLANTILAGCSIEARPFTPQEASDAAVAVCNLGLENWPLGGGETALPDAFLVGHDLVSAFQIGWTVLYESVCMYTAEQLIAVLAGLRCGDRQTQRGLDALGVEMKKQKRNGAPWRARDALDAIESLDMPAWAALLGLTGECPVLHAGIAASRDSRTRAVSATAFEFISENSQIASVRAFMQSLPDTLRG